MRAYTETEMAVMAATEDLKTALRAILPYARSRLEDMEENLEAGVDDPPHTVDPEAEAAVGKAREAVELAEAALR